MWWYIVYSYTTSIHGGIWIHWALIHHHLYTKTPKIFTRCRYTFASKIQSQVAVQFRTLLAFCFQHDPLPNASSQAASQPKMFQILVSHLTLCTVQTLQFVQLSGRINVFSSLDFFRCKQQVRLGTLVCSDICETSKTGKNSKTKENS